MKLKKLVQEKVPNKLKRLMVLITESHLKFLINHAVENPNNFKILDNEKK